MTQWRKTDAFKKEVKKEVKKVTIKKPIDIALIFQVHLWAGELLKCDAKFWYVVDLGRPAASATPPRRQQTSTRTHKGMARWDKKPVAPEESLWADILDGHSLDISASQMKTCQIWVIQIEFIEFPCLESYSPKHVVIRDQRAQAGFQAHRAPRATNPMYGDVSMWIHPVKKQRIWIKSIKSLTSTYSTCSICMLNSL